jgi:hypothetical protein
MAIRVAATLRLAELTEDAARSADELAKETGTHSRALERLLRHLVDIGLFSEADGRFEPTALGNALRSDGVSPLSAEHPIGRIELAASRMLDTVRTGRPAYDLVYGTGFWEDLAANPDLSARFDAYMRGDGERSEVVAARDWGHDGVVVDVGGGDGTLLTVLLRAHPALRGILVELPGPAEAARRRFAAESLADRTAVFARSFFGPLPRAAGVYVLSNVLHDWPDREAASILRRCAQAAGPEGSVLVIDAVLEAPSSMGGFDLFMLVGCGGHERVRAEWEALGQTAGLSLNTIQTINQWASLLEFRPER